MVLHTSIDPEERQLLLHETISKLSKTMVAPTLPAHILAATATDTAKHISGFDFSEQFSHRSKTMKGYFKSELSELTTKVIERASHDFTRYCMKCNV